MIRETYMIISGAIMFLGDILLAPFRRPTDPNYWREYDSWDIR